MRLTLLLLLSVGLSLLLSAAGSLPEGIAGSRVSSPSRSLARRQLPPDGSPPAILGKWVLCVTRQVTQWGTSSITGYVCTHVVFQPAGVGYAGYL
jgi:hypothetical protein